LSLDVNALSLTKHFGQIRALYGVSFNIKPGEIYGLIGPNGAGKTTSLRIICTLIKPTTGQLRFLSKMQLSSLKKRVKLLVIYRKNLVSILTSLEWSILSLWLSSKERLILK
jgi:ABC-2 type transport system ATP-binding protein